MQIVLKVQHLWASLAWIVRAQIVLYRMESTMFISNSCHIILMLLVQRTYLENLREKFLDFPEDKNCFQFHETHSFLGFRLNLVNQNVPITWLIIIICMLNRYPDPDLVLIILLEAVSSIPWFSMPFFAIDYILDLSPFVYTSILVFWDCPIV